MKKLDFKNPPIVELICGVQFDPINLDFNSVLEFYDRIKKEYPIVETKVPMQINFDFFSLEYATKAQFDNKPLIRLWFTTEKGERLIQIQNNRFFYNWRKNEDDKNIYPHYNQVFSEFQKNFKIFSEIMHKNAFEINLNQLELTYLDHIKPNEFTDISDIFSIFNKDETYKKIDNFNFSFSLPVLNCNAHYYFTLYSALKSNTNDSVIVLDSTVRGDLNGEIKIVDDWFKEAHDIILNEFNVQTTDKAKKLWQLSQ